MKSTNQEVDKFDYININKLFHYKAYLKVQVQPTDGERYLK